MLNMIIFIVHLVHMPCKDQARIKSESGVLNLETLIAAWMMSCVVRPTTSLLALYSGQYSTQVISQNNHPNISSILLTIPHIYHFFFELFDYLQFHSTSRNG